MNNATTTKARQERMQKIKDMLIDDPMLDIKDIAKTFGIKRDQVLKLLDAIGETGWSLFNPAQNTVLCDCSCPEWGKLAQGVYLCQCDCGKQMNVCGACLQSGRRTSCGTCK
jgi:hypothetical protein